jgi:hypothetical protein
MGAAFLCAQAASKESERCGSTLYRIAGYFKDGFDAFKNFPVDFCRGDTEQVVASQNLVHQKSNRLIRA